MYGRVLLCLLGLISISLVHAVQEGETLSEQQLEIINKNQTEIWRYIALFRNAVEAHLKDMNRRIHTLEHQVADMSHHHHESTTKSDSSSHSDDHHQEDNHHGDNEHAHDNHHGSSHDDHHGSSNDVHHGSSHDDHHGSSHDDHHGSSHDDHHGSSHDENHGSSHDEHHGSSSHDEHHGSSSHEDHHESSSHEEGSSHHDHPHSPESDNQQKENSHTDHHGHHGDSHQPSSSKSHHNHHHNHHDYHRGSPASNATSEREHTERIMATYYPSFHNSHYLEPPRKYKVQQLTAEQMLALHRTQDHKRPNNTTKFPKSEEYNQFVFGQCHVEANTAVTTNLQPNVRGEVTFWQKKTGGPMGVHIRLGGFRIHSVEHHHHQQKDRRSRRQIVNRPPGNRVPEPGHRHGLHIHELNDLSRSCETLGDHYNPRGMYHGAPNTEIRHIGDLGNIECDERGYANLIFTERVTSLIGPESIFNRGLIIHQEEDDFGQNKHNSTSLLTGNAGPRIACCVIEQVPRPSVDSFRYSEWAVEYKNDL